MPRGSKLQWNRAFLVICAVLPLSGTPLSAGAAPGAPIIVTQPQSFIATAGQTAAFRVVATGDAPLRYLWAFNRVIIPGSTNSTLVLPNVGPANVGSYIAGVYNARGYALSDEVTLTLEQPTIPVITQQPQSQTVAPNSNVTIHVAYTGIGPFRVQWQRNANSIAGATNDSLTLANIQPADAGNYSVVVSTDAGAVLSDTAAVRVSANSLLFRDQFDLQFTIPTSMGVGVSQNRSATTEPGEPPHAGKPSGRSVWIAWLPSASGIATISLAGSSFDTVLAIYTGNAFGALTEIASDDDSAGSLASAVTFNAVAGTHYKIVVAGLGAAAGDFTFAWSLQPTAEPAPQIVTHPISLSLHAGQTAAFAVQAAPANALLQWLFNGQEIIGATTDSLTLTNAGESSVGLYSVRVTHSGRSAESRSASLQINSTGAAAQPVLTSDKLPDAFQSTPLRLGTSRTAFARHGITRMASAAPPVNRGYAGTHLFSNFGAVSEPGEPLHCGLPGGASYWFALAAEETGEIRLDTDGSTFDTVLAVYTADGLSFADLQPVACDNNSGSDGRDSRLTFNAEAGVVYYIAIDGLNGARGAVRLNYALLARANLVPLGRNAQGANLLRLSGQPAGTFEVQASLDCFTWTRLFVTNLPFGACDFLDRPSTDTYYRYYRAVTLSP